MIILKYHKKDAYTYLSHIDVLRHLTRTIRRADLTVSFSQGFNPHMLLNMSVPLPLGHASTAEYVTIQTDMDEKEFLERFNQKAPKGLFGLDAVKTEKNPNLAGKVLYCDYAIQTEGVSSQAKEEIEAIPSKSEYVIPYPTRKAPDGEKNVIPGVLAMWFEGDILNVRAGVGQATVRADILSQSLAKIFGFTLKGEVCRTKQYLVENGELIEVDIFLQKLRVEK